MVKFIRYVYLISMIDGNMSRIMKLPRLATETTPLGDEFTAAIEFLNAMIKFISYIANFPFIVNVSNMRLETAGKIAGQVAHDFNNLLGPLIAYPDLIKTELDSQSVVNDYIDDMKAAAQQIADINQQLLTLGRRGHYSIDLINLNDLVNQVLSRAPAIPGSLRIEKNLSTNLENIKGGGSQIIRTISNLISNAREAMDDDGVLTIKTENVKTEDHVGTFGVIPRSEYVLLEISDTGAGIPQDVIHRIREPFFSTKSATRKHGSGLGLSVVNSVVEDHGGFMDCKSRPGEGTSMLLYFPVSRDFSPPRDKSKVGGGQESILVVDDDPLQRSVASKLLERLGYKVKTVASGEEAIEVLQKMSFDLLLLDMVLPDGIDGTETYSRAKKINPTQKALLFSGYAESHRVARALELGVGGFLRKPLTMEEIASRVRAELDRVVPVP